MAQGGHNSPHKPLHCREKEKEKEKEKERRGEERRGEGRRGEERGEGKENKVRKGET